MARLQTKSGGFVIDPAFSYPVYVSISNETEEVQAILNTGPASDSPLPEGYDNWIDGPHALFVLDAPGALLTNTARAGYSLVTAVFVPIPGTGGGTGDRVLEGQMMAIGKWMNN